MSYLVDISKKGHTLCHRWKNLKPGYTGGKKYCAKCEMYLVTDKIMCPCCNINLRYKCADKNLTRKRKEKMRVLLQSIKVKSPQDRRTPESQELCTNSL